MKSVCRWKRHRRNAWWNAFNEPQLDRLTRQALADHPGFSHGMSIWLLAALIGVPSWTLIEYLPHRFVLHRIALIAVMHDAHHQVPLAFIGTPTWLSLDVIGAMAFVSAWALGSLNAANGLSVW